MQPARPTGEPGDGSFPLPAPPPGLRVVAADGSQVYPDRHGAAFFYVVNVGSIALAHGSGMAPQVYTHSRLHFTDDDLQDTRGQPVDTHLINARRDAAELEEVARLAGAGGGAAGAPGARQGVTDPLLFGRRLSPLARSARYRHPAKLNEVFAERGHEVHFFYLHTGAQDGIARVEVPAWVAEDPQRMAAVHAGLFDP